MSRAFSIIRHADVRRAKIKLKTGSQRSDNNFFSNIGPNLAKQIPSVDGNIGDFLQGSFSNSMFVYNTDTNEIFNIVSMLKTSSSKGFDDIAPKIVKSVIDEI